LQGSTRCPTSSSSFFFPKPLRLPPVRQSTLDVYPDGRAAKANVMPLTELRPSPDFEKVVETCGGRGEKVTTSAELLPALERSLKAVRSGTPATLNVMTQAR